GNANGPLVVLLVQTRSGRNKITLSGVAIQLKLAIQLAYRKVQLHRSMHQSQQFFRDEFGLGHLVMTQIKAGQLHPMLRGIRRTIEREQGSKQTFTSTETGGILRPFIEQFNGTVDLTVLNQQV